MLPTLRANLTRSAFTRSYNAGSFLHRAYSRQQRQETVFATEFCANPNNTVITLSDGVLTDQDGLTGAIVAQGQFQFDENVQVDSRYVAGFSICGNGSLAIAGTTIFYQCLVAGENRDPFVNLYLTSQRPDCNQIYIETTPCPSDGAVSGSSSASAPASATSSVAAAPATSSVSAAPFPVPSNGTAPSPTASGAPGSPAPVPYEPGSGASAIIIGGNLVALAALIGAFVIF